MSKRFFDLFISFILLIPLVPIFIIISLLIKLGSKGPVFFIQDRLGLHGTVFRMYKFRTMVVNAETIGTGLFSYEDDPRITRVGKYLRISSLDELPQILNVLVGTMSLVGPRPPVTYELGDYSTFTETMKKRFEVKPGITGLAQISGRNELDWDQKIVFDNLYVDRYRKFGLLEDVRILCKTAYVVLTMRSTIEQRKED